MYARFRLKRQFRSCILCVQDIPSTDTPSLDPVPTSLWLERGVQALSSTALYAALAFLWPEQRISEDLADETALKNRTDLRMNAHVERSVRKACTRFAGRSINTSG